MPPQPEDTLCRPAEKERGDAPYQVFPDIVRRHTPLGHEQTPEDVGKLTAFLCSNDACNITSQVIALDGGSTLRGGS